MSSIDRVELTYQLRKSLLILGRALMQARKANDVPAQSEIKKCIDIIKRTINANSRDAL